MKIISRKTHKLHKTLSDRNTKVVRHIILLTILLVFTFQLKAQNHDLPPNPKAGKCYERTFNIDEKYKWNEVDCKKVKKRKDKILNEEDKIKAKAFWNTIKNYQTELKKAGYKVNINGILDDLTITAHHKYLKQRKKAERKKQKAEKRKAKSE